MFIRPPAHEIPDSPGAIVASALSFIKAKATGEPYKVENDTAEL